MILFKNINLRKKVLKSKRLFQYQRQNIYTLMNQGIDVDWIVDSLDFASKQQIDMFIKYAQKGFTFSPYSMKIFKDCDLDETELTLYTLMNRSKIDLDWFRDHLTLYKDVHEIRLVFEAIVKGVNRELFEKYHYDVHALKAIIHAVDTGIKDLWFAEKYQDESIIQSITHFERMCSVPKELLEKIDFNQYSYSQYTYFGRILSKKGDSILPYLLPYKTPMYFRTMRGFLMDSIKDYGIHFDKFINGVYTMDQASWITDIISEYSDCRDLTLFLTTDLTSWTPDVLEGYYTMLQSPYVPHQEYLKLIDALGKDRLEKFDSEFFEIVNKFLQWKRYIIVKNIFRKSGYTNESLYQLYLLTRENQKIDEIEFTPLIESSVEKIYEIRMYCKRHAYVDDDIMMMLCGYNVEQIRGM